MHDLYGLQGRWKKLGLQEVIPVIYLYFASWCHARSQIRGLMTTISVCNLYDTETVNLGNPIYEYDSD